MMVIVAARPSTAVAAQTRGIQTLRMGIVSGRVIIPSILGSTGFYWVLLGSAGFWRVLLGSFGSLGS
jgi:hypothetical protein